MGGAAELSLGHQLDAQAGEDLRGGHRARSDPRKVPTVADQLPLRPVPCLHLTEW